MADKDNQSIENLILKKSLNRVKNLQNRLERIKASETKIKKEGINSLTKEQLDGIRNKENLITSMKETEKMCESIKETINAFEKNTQTDMKKKEDKIIKIHDEVQHAKDFNNMIVKEQNDESLKRNMNSPRKLNEGLNKEKVIIVEEKITEKVVQDSTLSNFFFKLLSVCRVFIRNDAVAQYHQFLKENKKAAFDFDILFEVWRNLISFGIEDNVLSAQNRIEGQLDKCDKEGFNSLMICEQKLAKIEHELDKMIKCGFIEQSKNLNSSNTLSLSPRKNVDVIKIESSPKKDDSSISQLKSEIISKIDEKIDDCIPESTKKLVNDLTLDVQKAADLKNQNKEVGWGDQDNSKITDEDGFSVVTKSKSGTRKNFDYNYNRRGGYNNNQYDNYDNDRNQRRGGNKPYYNDKPSRGSRSYRSNLKQP